MKVRSLNSPSDLINWDTKASRWPVKPEAACRSKIQYQAGRVLKNKYPLDPILEDITIPETRLSLDFFLPQRSLAVEIQGGQHFAYNPFFHKSKSEFKSQQFRDDEKKRFCEINGIQLIRVASLEELEEELK